MTLRHLQPFNRRDFCRWCGLGFAATFAPAATRGEQVRDGVLYPKRIPELKGEFSWHRAIVETIPPLRHDRGSRWPMITWEGFSNQPQEPDYYRQLLDRGLAQHIRLDPNLIGLALAIQRSGSPVIVMEGNSGTFPASLAGEPSTWAHQFDEGYKPQEYTRPCPSLFLGWAKAAEKLRDTLRQFQKKGVQIDAVWTDWENDPLYGADRYEQARHCKRCREILPRRVMASDDAFTDYTARKFYELFGAYVAAPVLEAYPKCSVTNWAAMPSTPDQMQLGWSGRPDHIHMPPLITGWNPTAYGAASWIWKSRSPQDKRDQEHVDRVYTNVLLRQVSLTASLGRRWAPENESIPWVCRWVSEPPELEFPVMSRPRYRETLRHIWLRGVNGMQIFNPRSKAYEDMAMAEVVDGVAVYDEMLAFRDFLDNGEVLNCEVPNPHDDGVVWSGMRVENRAVVRVFRQGPGDAVQTVRPWPDKSFDLKVPSNGKTYLLERAGTIRATDER